MFCFWVFSTAIAWPSKWGGATWQKVYEFPVLMTLESLLATFSHYIDFVFDLDSSFHVRYPHFSKLLPELIGDHGWRQFEAASSVTNADTTNLVSFSDFVLNGSWHKITTNFWRENACTSWFMNALAMKKRHRHLCCLEAFWMVKYQQFITQTRLNAMFWSIWIVSWLCAMQSPV